MFQTYKTFASIRIPLSQMTDLTDLYPKLKALSVLIKHKTIPHDTKFVNWIQT
jgi:hypothetical protein